MYNGYGMSVEDLFCLLVRANGLPAPEREYRFHQRRWRFDFAWPAERVAVEIEGAVYTRGRHTRGAGFSADCVKYNEAAAAGWCVLRFPTDVVARDPRGCMALVKRALKEE